MFWSKLSFKEYEGHVGRVLRRKYPKTEWVIEHPSPIKTRGKVDFRVTNRKTGREILVDAKSGRISVNDLRQLEDYKRSTKPNEVIIYTCTPLTDISNSIKQRAKKSGIKILHTSPRPRSSF